MYLTTYKVSVTSNYLVPIYLQIKIKIKLLNILHKQNDPTSRTKIKRSMYTYINQTRPFTFSTGLPATSLFIGEGYDSC